MGAPKLTREEALAWLVASELTSGGLQVQFDITPSELNEAVAEEVFRRSRGGRVDEPTVLFTGEEAKAVKRVLDFYAREKSGSYNLSLGVQSAHIKLGRDE